MLLLGPGGLSLFPLKTTAKMISNGYAIVPLLPLLHRGVLAFPQGITAAPSSDCTGISTWIGLETPIPNYHEWSASMDSTYSELPATGVSATVFTTVVNHGGQTITAYGFYDSNHLSSEGYEVLTELVTTTEPCEPSVTLPPSPTGSDCSPHGDHWHCEPTTPPSSETEPPTEEECEPHGDHWHCPPGVPEPTTPPPSETEPPAEEECEPHGDHWHCPPGVPEPTTPPPAETEPPAEQECEPHGDHWHCPPGVPEPTDPPAAESPTPTGSPSEECEPHGDHWHCPSGVPEPTTPPPSETDSSEEAPETSPSPPMFTGGASKSGGFALKTAFLGSLFAGMGLLY
ncbi:hypothetical protein BJX61DRAFT_209306 [Aspergillus egyptiacus]|nr:hypothetical protein BJX61DRAFT_209306 [Aspergillus egyptiacus]